MPNVFDQSNKEEPEAMTEPNEPTHISTDSKYRYQWWNKTSVMVCADCGSLVANIEVHDQFHNNFDHTYSRSI